MKLTESARFKIFRWAKFGVSLFALGLITYGAWQAWRPAGPIVLGALLLLDTAFERVRK